MGEIDEACELMCFRSKQVPSKLDCDVISHHSNPNDPSEPDCNGVSHHNNPNDLRKADCDGISHQNNPNDCNGISHFNNSNDLNSSCVIEPGADACDLNDSCVVVAEGETSDDSSYLNSYSVVEQGNEIGDDDSSDLSDSSVVVAAGETGDDLSDLDDSNDLNSSCVVEAGIGIGVDYNDLNTSSVGNVEEIDEFPPLVKVRTRKKESSCKDHLEKNRSWAKVVTIPRKSFPAKVNFLDAENEKLETINRDVEDPSTAYVANVEVEVCNGKLTTDLNGDSSDYKNIDASIILETEHDEDMGDDLDGTATISTNEELYLQENCHGKDISMASSEDFGADVINGDSINIKVATKPFHFLIRAPRLDDGSLVEKVRLAKLQLDEKTKVRDSIHLQVKEKRANSQFHVLDYENAKGEDRSPRNLIMSKRMEIGSLQSMINKAKNASSIEDMNSQIRNMEHMIQHSTLSLNEERKLIREISQLNQHRRKLSTSFGSKDEIRQILEQREEFEERLKILREELDILKESALKAQEVALDERKQIRAANDVRQAAYVKLQSLKKELFEKNKHFYKYKDDAALACNYASSRDTEALYRLCTNHVENFMDLWNKNDEFRKEYVRFNARSSVRKFGTLDGRSLGPDELPSVLPSHVNERAKMVSTVDLQSQTEVIKQETTPENMTPESENMEEVTGGKNKNVANTGPAKEIGLDYSDSGKEIGHEELEKSRDEIDAELKEKRRLEEIDKANKARERKKRQEEKLQMRAELKTQKEAERKEKEREKRLRKKERKKAAAAPIDVNAIEEATCSESAFVISNEISVEEISSYVAPKKPQKSLLLTKQSKAKSVPPLVRSRNKKKLQQLMWASIAIVVLLLVLWLVRTRVYPTLTIKW